MKESAKVLEEFRNPKFTFGKYKGTAIKDVARHNPAYIVWVYNNVSGHGNVPISVYESALADARRMESGRNPLASEGEDYDECGMDYDPYAAYGGFFDGTSYGY